MTVRQKEILNELNRLSPIASKLACLVPLKGSNEISVLSRIEFDNAFDAAMEMQKLDNELINGERTEGKLEL